MENDILLPSTKHVLASESDVFLNKSLQQTSTQLPIDLFQKIISNYEVYLKEREHSFNYRVYGNMFMIASNVLCNLDGELGYEGVETARNFDDELNTYEYELNEIFFNDNGWYYYMLLNEGCSKFELEPQKVRFKLTDTNIWKTYLTYPAAINLSPIKFNDLDISEGLAVLGGGNTEVDGKELSYLICPLTHNIQVGDSINLYNEDGFQATYTIYQTGLSDNTYKKNVFFLDQKIDFLTTLLTKKYRFKKVVEGVESQYYSRWFKRLTDTEDIDVFQTSFSQNIYKDKNYSFVIPKTIDLTGIVDYLKRPLTELYISVLKITDNDFWGDTLCAINTYFSNINYDFNMVYQGGALLPVEVIQDNQTYYFGDIVEYNPKTLVENTLNFAVHVFNTKNRIDNNLIESFYYTPHTKKNIKVFSDYIVKEDGILTVPEYASDYNGLKQWREILQTESPYLNKHHYLYYNFNLFIRRQDPCKTYGIGDNALIDGRCLNTDVEKIVNIEKIC